MLFRPSVSSAEKNLRFNSTKLIKEFTDIKFDIFWIDGDHYNPQVTMDILNSMQLAHENSIICVDDICFLFPSLMISPSIG